MIKYLPQNELVGCMESPTILATEKLVVTLIHSQAHSSILKISLKTKHSNSEVLQICTIIQYKFTINKCQIQYIENNKHLILLIINFTEDGALKPTKKSII